MVELISNKGFLLVMFFALGLLMGRVSALLTELFSVTMPADNPDAESDNPDASAYPTDTESAKNPDTKAFAFSAEGKSTYNTPASSIGDSVASAERATTLPAGSAPLSPPTNALLKNGLWAFFADCQNKWGHLPCSYPFNSHARKQKGALRPFILELLMGALFALLIHYVGWKYLLLEYLLFTFAVVTASAVDWEHMILPDSLTLSGIGIGLAGALLNPEAGREFLPALAGMFMGGGFLWLIAYFYYSLKKEEGLGGGDIKLLAWIGAILTWKAVPFVILLACLTGLLAGVLMMFRSASYLKQSIPFGPYLAFSALVYIFWGQNLARLYLSWFFYP